MDLTSKYISIELFAASMGRFAAQTPKTIINYITFRKIEKNALFASGGMPSSHSATVSALAAAAGMTHGFNSTLFGIAFQFAYIVMYGAANVRREAGDRGKLLNDMLATFEDLGQPIDTDKMCKELVGHTPTQVVCGAVLGIVIGVLCTLK